MKAERLFRAIGLVDDDLVEETAKAPARKRPSWRRYGAMAACLAVLCGTGFAWLVTGGFHGYGAADGNSSAGGSGIQGTGTPDAIQFMSYAGPVLPLTTAEENPGVTAERHTDWDFTPRTDPEDGEISQWGASVTDRYILTNPTDADVTLTALYPIAGRLNELKTLTPSLTVNGETAETDLVIGGYAGGFRSAGGEDTSTLNLKYPDSWTDYQTLLEGSRYRQAALAEQPAADIPVTVYRFTDFAGPTDQYRAATQAVTFTADEARTTVLSYGFEGYGWDEQTGETTYSYFVPDGQRRGEICKLLVVLGDDLDGYTLQGYQDGGCDPGGEIDGVSCTVTRQETTLHAVIQTLCREKRLRALGRDRFTHILIDECHHAVSSSYQAVLDYFAGAKVLGVTATGDIRGPRGLQVGMTAQAAAGLFRCDADVYASGGALYIEGEAYGEPPFAEMSADSDGEATIRYLCRMENGEAARLDVGICGGVVGYWHLYTGEEAADGE